MPSRLVLLQLLALVHMLVFPGVLLPYAEFHRSVCAQNSRRSSAPRFYCRSLILSHIDRLFLLARKGLEMLK